MSDIKTYTSITDVRNSVDELLKKIEHGEIKPLEVAAMVGYLEKFCKQVRAHKGIREEIYKELEGGKGNFKGISIEQASRPTYDYSNSPAWTYIKEQENNFTELRKQIEEIARKTKGEEWVDEETGEIFVILPARKKVTDSFRVTLKK